MKLQRCALISALVSCSCSADQVTPLATTASSVHDGTVTDEMAEIASYRFNPANCTTQLECSAALLCPNVALTVNHCVGTAATSPHQMVNSATHVRGAGGNIMPGESTIREKHHLFTVNADGLVLLRLRSGYPDQPRVTLDETDWNPGDVGTAYGHGRLNDTAAGQYGTRRKGIMEYYGERVDAMNPQVKTLLFKRGTGTTFICGGDSGGPIFNNQGGALTGITQGGASAFNCNIPGVAANDEFRFYAVKPWAAAINAKLDEWCPAPPAPANCDEPGSDSGLHVYQMDVCGGTFWCTDCSCTTSYESLDHFCEANNLDVEEWVHAHYGCSTESILMPCGECWASEG